MRTENSKKGQSAMEYLMTYGWAILIVIIVAGVLAYYGVFNPPVQKNATGFPSLGVKDWKVSAAGTLTVVLTNKVGSDISITDVDAGTSTATPTGVPATVRAGSDSGAITLDSAVSAGKAGDRLSLNVTVSYTDTSTSIAHTSSGTLAGQLE